MSIKSLYIAFACLLIGFYVGYDHGIKNRKHPTTVQLNPDLRNQVQDLQIQVAVLKGQMSAITGRYNDYGDRLRGIEERMVIFNGQ